MPLRSFNPCFGFSRRTGAIAVSGFLLIFGFVFMALCFSQLSAGSMLPGAAQAGFAIASIMQVALVALSLMIIYASWKEDTWLIHVGVYLTVTHLALDLIVLGCLLAVVGSIAQCPIGPFPCPKLVASKPAWDVLATFILAAQLYLSLVVLSYFFYLQGHSRRAYAPEVSSRSLSAQPTRGLDRKRLLSSNSESESNVEMSAVESATITQSFKVPDPETGYGGGMRTYEEAEENEKARLRREMENETDQAPSFPIPSTSGAGILTPLGLAWRDGDLPPYTS